MQTETTRRVSIGKSLCIGDGQPLLLIAGPCVIEGESHALRMAERLKQIAEKYKLPLIYKSSFDKANRTSIDSYRGPGLDEGLRILTRVKAELDLPLLSDIHLPEQVNPAAEVLDVLQIPAFLCRQTDLLLAAGETGKAINIKKGQFVAPEDLKNVVAKVLSTGNRNVFTTERGTFFGYHDLVVDFRSLAIQRSLGLCTIFDGTHSVQKPSGGQDRSGGTPEFVAGLCRAAAAFGVDGLFLEVHDDPSCARCDADSMITPQRLDDILSEVVRIRTVLELT